MIRIELPRTFKQDLKALKRLIGTGRNGAGRLRPSFDAIAEEYSRYAATYKMPVLLQDCKKLRSGEEKLLNGLYDRKSKHLSYIGRLRRAAGRTLSSCPYCGMPTEDFTLDHYLPRAARLFPHFSVLTANLVPSCMTCQHKKGEFFPQSGDLRGRLLQRRRLGRIKRAPGGVKPVHLRPSWREPERILHPYFDRIFDTRRLRLLPAGSVRLLAPSQGNHVHTRAVTFHLRKLDLVERTAPRINGRLSFYVRLFSRLNVATVSRARDIARGVLEGDHAEAGHGGTIQLLIDHAVIEDDLLAADLVQKSLAPQPKLLPESKAVKLRF